MKSICWQNPVPTTSMMIQSQCDEKKEVCDKNPENSDSTYDKKDVAEDSSDKEKNVKVSTCTESNTSVESNKLEEMCQIMNLWQLKI